MKRSKKVYKIAAGAKISQKKAQGYGQFLEQLSIVSKGPVTPQAVVSKARSEDCPLHEYFEWDDSKAAYEHRLEQARGLIRSIRVVVKRNGDEGTERAFFNVIVTTKSGQDKCYMPVDLVAQDENLRNQIIAQAFIELIGWQRRYKNYQELGEIFGAIEKVQKSLELRT